MHELSITENVLAIVLGEAEKRGARRVQTIRLRIGEMTPVDTGSVEFYLDLMAKGTIAEGVRLETDHVPLRCSCRACGDEFATGDTGFRCPVCGSPEVDILTGRELYVDSIDIE